MGVRQVAALAAALAMCTPALASDLGDIGPSPSTMFYVSIPLDAQSPKEQMPVFGLALQGRRQYETLRLDTRMLGVMPLGGIEAKWLIVGGVAVAAAVAVGKKDKDREQYYQEQQQQQQQQPEPCPQLC